MPERRLASPFQIGPNWEHGDGSAVVGKVAASAPGAMPDDIPWLRLEVISRRGNGILSGVTTVQRINTRGGKLDGMCDTAGTFKSVPYSAEYVFLRSVQSRMQLVLSPQTHHRCELSARYVNESKVPHPTHPLERCSRHLASLDSLCHTRS